MTFSEEWNECYEKNQQINAWPFSDLIGFVMRYARPKKNGFRVLELGCGSGPNIPFFLTLDAEYHGIEGSESIVNRLWEKYPQLQTQIYCGDFTADLPVTGELDLVADRSALTHNSTQSIRNCLKNVHALLKPGGAYIGIDWFSTANPEFQNGQAGPDPYTRCGYTTGQFADVGRVHFSDKSHLLELFADFEMAVLEHKRIEREIPQDSVHPATWNFVAIKK